MNRERWTRIEDLFHQARADAGVLDRLGEEDLPLRAEVEDLLAANTETDRVSTTRKQLPSASLAGRRMGNYEIQLLLGVGGMGSVYLARRCDGQFERQVALKILGAHLRDEFFTARFSIERQLLAALDHPNITRLLDSGVSDSGDPYLVLEYVDGVPIDEYCDMRGLSIADRLRLFAQALKAVEYAHSHGVIHRDLKPSNLFVSRDGVIKLLDLGAAKLLETDSADSSNPTTRFRMMTPRYASPEQLRGEPMTAASDIYSLGVVLYELILGANPFGGSRSLLSGLERAIRSVEPAKPAISATDEAAACRQSTKAGLIEVASGELWKTLRKALQPAPEERYESAQAMAEDLHRVLSGERVLADPRAAAWPAHRKHWLAGLAAVTFLLVAIVFRFRSPAMVNPDVSSIALLPFSHPGQDEQAREVADGVIDRLRESLSRNRLLLVIDRSSSVLVPGQTASDAGKRLQAAYVLDGNIESVPDGVRIEARLTRTSDGARIWSNTFERKRTDVQSVDAALSAAVTANLRAVPGIPNLPHQASIEATEWMMRGRHDVQQGTPQALALAEADYRKAIELDSAYAPAYAALAGVIFSRYQAEFRDHTDAEVVEIEGLERKALELDPLLPAAHVTLGIIAHQYRWDWVTAEQEYTLGAAGAPDAQAECLLSLLLVQRGRFAEAEPHLKRALRLDPYGAATLVNTASAYFWMGQAARSIELAKRYHEAAPAAFQAQGMYLQTLVVEGREGEAWEGYRKLRERSPAGGAMFEAWGRSLAGQASEALRLIRPLEGKYPQAGIPLQGFALVYGRLGDEENTVKWLERSADLHEWQVLNMGVNPAFRSMRDSGGFRRLRKRIGLE